MHFKLPTALLSGLTIALGSASAQAYQVCEPFTLHTDIATWDTEHLDHSDEGLSVGDRRHTFGELRTDDGEVVGYFDGSGTVRHADADDNHRTASDVVVQLETGVLLYKVAPGRPVGDFSEAGANIPFETTRVIYGGSGAFMGALGTVNIDRVEDTLALTFDLSCR